MGLHLNRNCPQLTVSRSRKHFTVQIREMVKGILRLLRALFGEAHALMCIMYAGEGTVLPHTRRICV